MFTSRQIVCTFKIEILAENNIAVGEKTQLVYIMSSVWVYSMYSMCVYRMYSVFIVYSIYSMWVYIMYSRTVCTACRPDLSFYWGPESSRQSVPRHRPGNSLLGGQSGCRKEGRQHFFFFRIIIFKTVVKKKLYSRKKY